MNSFFERNIPVKFFYIKWHLILKIEVVLFEYQQILVFLKAVCIQSLFVPCHGSAQAC